MLANEKRTQNGLSVKMREVNVPNTELTGEVEHDLERIFHWGQNDFQPQRCCSVSVGDVIVYANDKLWLVGCVGFVEITDEQYLTLKRYDQRGLSLHPLCTGRPDDDPVLAKTMHGYGYRYRMAPMDKTFMPLYVKTATDVARIMREEYPDHRFALSTVEKDGTLKHYK
jgi:hypothetical protein